MSLVERISDTVAGVLVLIYYLHTMRDLLFQALLEGNYNTNVNITRSLGLVCPLIVASAMGFLDIVELLISHGADFEKVMGAGRTALHLAAAEGHLNVIMCLISNGETDTTYYQA